MQTANPERPLSREPGASLRVRTSRAAIASLGSELAGRALMVALTIATARVLQPSEVGLLGLATIVVGIAAMLAVYAETAAIVGSRDHDHGEYALTAFLLRAATTVLVVFLTRALEPVLAGWLTRDPGQAATLSHLVHILLWQLAVEALGAYPRVWLQRGLALATVSTINLLAMALHVAATIISLLAGYGVAGVVWAYVGASAVASGMFWAAMLGIGGALPSRWPNLPCWRDVLHDTMKLAAGGFVGYLNCRVDNLLVSGALGPSAMSFYGMAWNAARTPAAIVGRSASFVLVPTVARMQHERRSVERGLRDGLWYSYALLAPLCAGIYLAAPVLVEVVLGTKWLPVVPILRVMCVTVLLTPLLEISNSLLMALGRAHLSGIATALQLLTIVVAVPLCSRSWGLEGAAYADLLAATVDAAALCTTARLALPGIRWMALSATLGPLAAAMVAALCASACGMWIAHSMVRSLVEVASLVGFYPACLLALCGRERLRESIAMLGGVLGQWSPLPTR